MDFKLPPGKYYIGDPCYVFNDKDWDDIIGVSDCFQNEDIVQFKGHEMFAARTAYGDGSYRGSNGYEFGVDAGLLGAVPLEMVSADKNGLECGVVIDCPEGLEVTMLGRGHFLFGNIEINTDDPNEDEEYDDEYDEEDED